MTRESESDQHNRADEFVPGKREKCKSLTHNLPVAQQHLIGLDVEILWQLAIQAATLRNPGHLEVEKD